MSIHRETSLRGDNADEAIHAGYGLPRSLRSLSMTVILSLLFSLSYLPTSAPKAYAQDITTGLVGHWKLDETSGTDVIDYASGGNNGTMGGGLTGGDSVSGRVGTALHFDGNDDVITIGDNPSFDPTGEMSISLWFKKDAFNPLTGLLAAKSSGSDTEWSFFLEDINGNGKDDVPSFAICSGAGAGCAPGPTNFHRASATGIEIELNQWYHVVVVYDDAANAIEFYVNGELRVATTTYGSPFSQSIINTSESIVLGEIANGEEHDGTIDDVRIYDRALTADEVKELYKSFDGNLRYNTNTRAAEYFDGDNWVGTGAQKYIPNAVGFDSSDGDDRLRETSPVGLTDTKQFTFSVWLNLDDSATHDLLRLETPTSAALGIAVSSSQDSVWFTMANSVGTEILRLRTTTGQLVPGQWYHYVVSVDLSDNTKRYAYINDAVSMEALQTHTDETFPTSTVNQIDISESGGTASIDGSIADLWFDAGTYIDLSLEANRRKFIDDGGNPVYLGADGSRPTGASPDIFLSGDTDTWHTNKGTGGGFTENGTLETSSNPPGKSNPSFTLRGTTGANALLNKAEYTQKIGDYLFVGASNSDSISVVNVSDPDNPTVEAVNASGISDVQMFAVKGNYLYTAEDPGSSVPSTLYVIDISDPTNISIANTATAGDNSRCNHGITIYGDYLYVGCTEGAGQVWDISDPLNPSYINENIAGFGIEFLEVYNGYLYAAYGNNVRSYDLTDPTDPAELDIFDSADHPGSVDSPRDLAFKGNYMFVAGRDTDNIHVVDISDPSSLTYASQLDNVAGELLDPEGVFIDGDVLYATAHTNDYLNAIDISNPLNPVLIASITDASLDAADNVYIADGFAYVGSENSGVTIVDLGKKCTNPERLEGSIIYNTTSNVMQYCNGEDWIAMGPVPGLGGGGCSNPSGSAGGIVYNNSERWLQYCDGTNWRQMGGVGATVTQNGLVGWWRLDETEGTVIEDSAADNSGSLLGGLDPAVSTVAGKNGTAMSFDGDDDAINIGNSASIDPANFTACFWAKRDGAGNGSAWQEVMGNGQFQTAGWNINLEPEDSNITIFVNRSGARDSATIDVGATNEWHHYCATWDGTYINLYADGQLGDISVATSMVDGTANMYLGRNGPSSVAEFEGTLDDVRIYNRVLSAEEIKNIYLATGGAR